MSATFLEASLECIKVSALCLEVVSSNRESEKNKSNYPNAKNSSKLKSSQPTFKRSIQAKHLLILLCSRSSSIKQKSSKMSILLRDPLLRDLLFEDHDRNRQLRPYHYHIRQPVRVHRALNDGWPLTHSFDHALNELQSVMDNVNDAIGQYQSSLTKDLSAGGMRTTRTEDGNLQVAVDVAQFKPEEVNVKLCDDNLVVEAKTESSENDSYHRAEFKRWIKLPADVKHEAIKSTITPDNKLLIQVPMNKPIADSRSRNIPIDIQRAEEKAQVGSGDKPADKQQQNQAKK